MQHCGLCGRCGGLRNLLARCQTIKTTDNLERCNLWRDVSQGTSQATCARELSAQDRNRFSERRTPSIGTNSASRAFKAERNFSLPRNRTTISANNVDIGISKSTLFGLGFASLRFGRQTCHVIHHNGYRGDAHNSNPYHCTGFAVMFVPKPLDQQKCTHPHVKQRQVHNCEQILPLTCFVRSRADMCPLVPSALDRSSIRVRT